MHTRTHSHLLSPEHTHSPVVTTHGEEDNDEENQQHQKGDHQGPHGPDEEDGHRTGLSLKGTGERPAIFCCE